MNAVGESWRRIFPMERPTIMKSLSELRLVVLVLTLSCLVVACQGVVVGAKKAPGYDGQVRDLTILYFSRQAFDVAAAGTGTYAQPTRVEADRWLKTGDFEGFSQALATELPSAFLRHGVHARFERVEKLPDTLDAFAPGHVLVIDPFMVTVSTMSGSVTVAETVFEPTRSEFVWQGSAIVSLTMLGGPGAEGARSFSDRAAGALADSGLIPKAEGK